MSGHVEEFINEPYSTAIWLSIGITTVVLVVICYFSSMYYQASASDAMVGREEGGRVGYDLAELRAYENEMATALKWVDKEKGVVQIPMDVAMDLVVKSYQK
ncbi:hypothetical protein EBR57_00395 [bacterium]|nr:hypothetical protein [bacterium]